MAMNGDFGADEHFDLALLEEENQPDMKRHRSSMSSTVKPKGLSMILYPSSPRHSRYIVRDEDDDSETEEHNIFTKPPEVKMITWP